MTRRRLALDDVGSTNTVALEAARAGDPGALWVTARRQLAGRGRRGRPWVSFDGNLYASYLVLDPAPVAALGALPLVASLGVRNGLSTLPGLDPGAIRVKWPNDILAEGAKLVGVLLESERLRDGRMAVVVGCGVNVVDRPDDAPYATTSVSRLGGPADTDTVFAAVAGGIEAAFDRFAGGRGLAALRDEWLGHAIGVGEPCRVVLEGETVSGRFRRLDADGRLVLAADTGEERVIAAGDLFFLRQDARDRAPAPSA